MKIAAIGVALPGRRVTNDDVLRMLTEGRPRDVATRTLERSARSLLAATGADQRFYRDHARGERPEALVGAAMREALERAELAPEAIDLLLYCGLGRGFIEPANAYVCAQQLSLRCECFDVSDACMGWLRAAQIAHDGMLAGRYRHVLVVNAEFGIYERFEESFRVERPLDLRHSFAAYTLGEAATATVLSRDATRWSFAYRSRPDLASLCFYALPGHDGFVPEDSPVARTRPMTFRSHSAELFAAADRELGALLRQEIDDFSAPRLYVPHAASSTAAAATARRLGIPSEQLYLDIMPRYGNVASASLPLGLRRACDEGRLRAGDEVVLCPASAGLSVAVTRFRWGGWT